MDSFPFLSICEAHKTLCLTSCHSFTNRRPLPTGQPERSRHGGGHRPSALPLSRSRWVTPSPRQYILPRPIRNPHRFVVIIYEMENLALNESSTRSTTRVLSLYTGRLCLIFTFLIFRLLHGSKASLHRLLHWKSDRPYKEGLLPIRTLRPVLFLCPHATPKCQPASQPLQPAQ